MDSVASSDSRSRTLRVRLARGLGRNGSLRFVKFAIVGGSGVFVNLGVQLLAYSMLGGLGTTTLPLFGTVELAKPTSILVGIVVSIFTNFLLNDAWTWGDRAKGSFGDALRRCRDFYVTNGLAGGLQFAVAGVCLWFGLWDHAVFGVDLTGYDATLSSLVGIIVATPLNYLVNNVWTFRDRDDATD